MRSAFVYFRSWSWFWSCYFGLGLKNLVLFTSLGTTPQVTATKWPIEVIHFSSLGGATSQVSTSSPGLFHQHNGGVGVTFYGVITHCDPLTYFQGVKTPASPTFALTSNPKALGDCSSHHL